MLNTKEYEDLKFTDDFMFCKIMTTDLELCREVLELILDISIKEVKLPEGQKANIPPKIKSFFDYLKGRMPKDDLCRKIDDSVRKAVEHKEWRDDYMTLLMKYKEIYAEGRQEGENKLGRLILLLTKDGRVEDITKAASDDEYREKLYKEFKIE